MFEKMFQKFRAFEDNHQVLFALLVTFGFVCFSWGIERILEEYAFSKKLKSYIFAISLGLLILWLTKHVILNVM